MPAKNFQEIVVLLTLKEQRVDKSGISLVEVLGRRNSQLDFYNSLRKLLIRDLANLTLTLVL